MIKRLYILLLWQISIYPMQSCSTFWDDSKTYLSCLPIPLKERMACYIANHSTVKQKILLYAPLNLQSKIYLGKDDPNIFNFNNSIELQEPHIHCNYILKNVINIVSIHVGNEKLDLRLDKCLQGNWRGYVALLKNGQIYIKGSEGNTFVDTKTKEIKKTGKIGNFNEDLTKLIYFDEIKRELVIKDAVTSEQIHSIKYSYQCDKDGMHICKDPRFNKDGTKIVLQFGRFNSVPAEQAIETIDIAPLLDFEKQLNLLLPTELVILESIYNKLQKKGPQTTRKYLKRQTKQFDEKLGTPLISAAFLAMRRKLRANLP